MDVITEEQMKRRQAHFRKKEEEKVDRLIAKYNKTGDMGIANYLFNRYGIGDFDQSPDGNIGR